MKSIIKYFASLLCKHNPELLVRIRYWFRFRKRLNLNNPQTLNEKILYLSLRTDTSEWTRLSDKYQVREYVHECGLDSILNRLYGVWNNTSEIDFNSLPDRFILKTNHGSGDSIIVQDKNSMNLDLIIKKLDRSLSETYGLAEGSLHYSRIVPKIIAEELLENDSESSRYSTSLIDYKIWCFNGKAHYIWTCTDRTKKGTKVMTYDSAWNAHPEYSVYLPHYMEDDVIPKPRNLTECTS